MKITFGKHKGEEIKDIPPEYRKWLLTQDWFSKFTDLREEILELDDAPPAEAARTEPKPVDDEDCPF